MKNKILFIFWAIFSIPSSVLLINLFINVNSSLITFMLGWFISQLFLFPLFYTVVNIIQYFLKN
jgi:hypothetical protein